MDRYARQTFLKEIGMAGQAKLKNASVLVVGAGGLGCPALQYLTAAGVGHIGITDFDDVDQTNLQRQILFDVMQVGKNKALAAKEKLTLLNPDVKISTFTDGLNTQNIEELFSTFDIIIDGTDNFDSKYLINDAALKFHRPVIFGAINQFEGHISVFNYKGGPCYRCLYPEKPKNHIPNCAEAGVIGAVAGTIGTLQAMEAIKMIVSDASFKSLNGHFFSIDLKTMRTRNLEIQKDANCSVCSKNPENIELKKTTMISCAIPQQITARETKNIDALFIDVREEDEWNNGHIEGAELHPLSKMMEGNLPNLPKDQTVIIYCKSGQRSQYAIELLKAKGHTNLINMSDGYLGWQKAF